MAKDSRNGSDVKVYDRDGYNERDQPNHAGRIEAGHSIGADGQPVLANAAIDVLGALGELDLRHNWGYRAKQ